MSENPHNPTPSGSDSEGSTGRDTGRGGASSKPSAAQSSARSGADVSGSGNDGLTIGMRPTELPGASLTPEEIAKRASGRGSWHRRASKPVSYWMFGVIIAILVHRFIPKGGWLIVHMVTLGLITNSILIWSQHFTEALMKIKIPDSARGIQVTRIFALNGGIVLLMAGMILQDLMPQFYPLTVVGALAVGAMVTWHG